MNPIKIIILSAALLTGPARSSLPSPPASTKNVIAYFEAGRFGGWPANGGIWSWGDEIAVCVTRAWFKHNPEEHSVDRDKPGVTAIVRSLDGGETWQMEEHKELQMSSGAKSAPGGINFTHPDFAMRVRDGMFFYSYDRGRTWRGPYTLPDFKLGDQLTSRTDYIVNGPADCHLFVSVKDEKVQSGIPDRAFAIRTQDGGKTFVFLGWMTGEEPPMARSVMPATVRTSDGAFVSLLRRRFDLKIGYRNDVNWLDAYGSKDDGRSWKFLARIAYTDTSFHNGNPPSLVQLPDGRLAAAYGVRSRPFGIRARVSSDHGVSWGSEFILRDDARTWDIGYCRSVVRPDGKIVTVYYYATKENFENHIAATIWSPPAE